MVTLSRIKSSLEEIKNKKKIELHNRAGFACALHTTLLENLLLRKKNRESTKPRLVNDTMTTLSLEELRKTKYYGGSIALFHRQIRNP
jgi:hypothetical protein